MNAANFLARELAAQGIAIVSGLARGIDGASHRGAIEAAGKTVGVIGTGLDVIYPKEHKKLTDEVAENGAVVSEFPLGTPPLAQNFPYRNRVISGLCFGILVVEASEHSGSLITARLAHEQGRVELLPGKTAKRDVPHRQTRMLVIISRGEVLLEKRPPTGIWGGLWSLPELPVEADILNLMHSRYGLAGRATREMARVDHGFTHFSLSIYPVEITAGKIPLRAMEPGLIWQNLDDAMEAAIPAPVKRILKLVQSTHSSKR